jgi:hypothetical protein
MSAPAELDTCEPRAGPLQCRADAIDGELLASWEYDSAPGGIGLPHREVRPSPDGDWVNEIPGYVPRSRPNSVTLTVPTGVEGLAGSYAFTNAYDGADRVIESTIPRDRWPARRDDQQHLRRSRLRPEDDRARGLRWLVLTDDRGRRQNGWIGPESDGAVLVFKEWSYNQDQMPAQTTTNVRQADGSFVVGSEHQLSYDDAGNVSDRLTSQNGLSWRERYGYDARSWRGSPARPTSIGDGTYSWNGNGNLAGRTVDGAAETFTWDIEQRLASVESDGSSTDFFYDISGQRLLRDSDDGTTVYLAGHEVTVDAAGTVVDAVRPYRSEPVNSWLPGF